MSLKKTIGSRFKKYAYNTCDDLKNSSGEDIIRLDPSQVNVDLFNNSDIRRGCKAEQIYAIDYFLKELKIKKRQGQLTQQDVEEEVRDFYEQLRSHRDKTTRAISTTRKSVVPLTSKGGYRRHRRRNTKKKRKN